MPTTFDRLTADIDAFARDQITAGAHVDDVTSALLQKAGALLVENFGTERCAKLLRICADAVEGRRDGR